MALLQLPEQKDSFLLLFLDAIASQEIRYMEASHYVRTEQSVNHLLGKGSRPFRQSKDVKKGNIAIITITSIIAITVSMAIAAFTAIAGIRAITASTGIRVNYSQYNYYCQ